MKFNHIELFMQLNMLNKDVEIQYSVKQSIFSIGRCGVRPVATCMLRGGQQSWRICMQSGWRGSVWAMILYNNKINKKIK